ncbi:hypothetical protein CONPUDRAFT_69532 [Coniophora puteana RWD-64-598 SS2]|uniref:Uncharacterized protein n=1 Tax=Coniophora puteana (strain RWD-64-598) TaxID=741705 RepID=A0A5M3N763_CONPW|nr:uncharacterized protein CONPUDRAFT_69532 [Coniophora puteana RWD-64-598 SS2]EIW87273.1 hypothetical protein CONPUDRAFT_69532 [Coniophora puteana RWD-64-598 SS2]
MSLQGELESTIQDIVAISQYPGNAYRLDNSKSAWVNERGAFTAVDWVRDWDKGIKQLQVTVTAKDIFGWSARFHNRAQWRGLELFDFHDGYFDNALSETHGDLYMSEGDSMVWSSALELLKGATEQFRDENGALLYDLYTCSRRDFVDQFVWRSIQAIIFSWIEDMASSSLEAALATECAEGRYRGMIVTGVYHIDKVDKLTHHSSCWDLDKEESNCEDIDDNEGETDDECLLSDSEDSELQSTFSDDSQSS